MLLKIGSFSEKILICIDSTFFIVLDMEIFCYHIAGKFGGHKVWQIQSSKYLAKKSLANE